ncbi:cytochrome C biogenesis protein [Methanocella sp. CWC-04]|uniref:Cytochrome C biogenesis protein n=1 Tax=Methanooceanicella nereidis TaxID=2052831 RepID=A0AAP2W573_9EURY|nr:cytochrome C biogenesis protein [Methanocella sp. CWC-04]
MALEQWLLALAVVAAVLFMIISFLQKNGSKSIYLMAAGCVLIVAALSFRWYYTGRPPWATLYETASLLALATGIAATYGYHKKYSLPFYMIAAAFTASLVSFSALSWDPSPIISGSLNSGWLMVHVPVLMLSYGMFAISAAASFAIVFHIYSGKFDSVSMAKLDSIAYRSITAGMLLIIPGIIMGSIWANTAWGSYWSWDPKETWSLITVIVYLLYLILRRTGMKAEDAAFVSILGFLSVIFTYFGVSYIIPGLHSYA